MLLNAIMLTHDSFKRAFKIDELSKIHTEMHANIHMVVNDWLSYIRWIHLKVGE